MSVHELAPEADGLIRGIVRRELSGSSIDDIDISVGNDHDGEEAIIVEIIYGVPEPDVDPKQVAGLMMAVNRELYDAGESRFVYVYNRSIQNEPSFGLK